MSGLSGIGVVSLQRRDGPALGDVDNQGKAYLLADLVWRTSCITISAIQAAWGLVVVVFLLGAGLAGAALAADDVENSTPTA